VAHCFTHLLISTLAAHAQQAERAVVVGVVCERMTSGASRLSPLLPMR
jgi:hypothetical protein